MSKNNRILYSCQVPSILPCGAGASGTKHSEGMVHGVQSIGVTTNFNLEQAFELGQIEIYENIEGLPDVEVTMEKLLDGYPLMYLLATTGVTGSSASGLLARSKERCDVSLGIFGEEYNNVATALDNNGDAEVQVYMSGMYISSISYTIPVDGNATESITLVGNNKEWLVSSAVNMSGEAVGSFDGNDAPFSLAAGSGGIQRREDVRLDYSILPQAIQGVRGSGYGNAYGPVSPQVKHYEDGFTASGLGVHVQNITISTDFSREDVLELGAKSPYYRPASFPVEVTCEIEAVTTSGDFITALEAGDPQYQNMPASGNNTGEENIFIALRGGMVFDLGRKNRLASVSYGGADATGGNAACTYSYTNFNDLDVRQVGHNPTGTMAFGGPNADGSLNPFNLYQLQ